MKERVVMNQVKQENYCNESTNLLEKEVSPWRKQCVKKIGAVVLATSLFFSGVFGLGGCGKATNERRPNVKQEQKERKPNQEIKKSESETRYANYLNTLTPEQQVFRESLEPDNLAKMSSAELTEVFTIKPQQVVDESGKIDPAKLAEAYIARRQGMANSGISYEEYKKWGGLDKFGISATKEASNNYYVPESTALFGKSGDGDGAEIALSRGVGVDRIKKANLDESHDMESYRYRRTVQPNSIKSSYTNEKLNVYFTIDESDNWNYEIMHHNGGGDIKPLNNNMSCAITGLSIRGGGMTVLADDYQEEILK
jgi:hypothetical protein